MQEPVICLHASKCSFFRKSLHHMPLMITVFTKKITMDRTKSVPASWF